MNARRAFEAHLRLSYSSEGEAKAIYDAVAPDNKPLPPGLKIEMALDGRELLIDVSCLRGLESLWATLDDLLSCIQVAERALRAISGS